MIASASEDLVVDIADVETGDTLAHNTLMTHSIFRSLLNSMNTPKSGRECCKIAMWPNGNSLCRDKQCGPEPQESFPSGPWLGKVGQHCFVLFYLVLVCIIMCLISTRFLLLDPF